MQKIILAIAFMHTNLAIAQKSDISHVDAILDRLERRLLDQEAEGLTFSEKNAQNDGQNEKEKSSSYKFPKKTIETVPPNIQKIDEVSRLVRELEQQVDQLASNVQKTKQTIIDDAAINNFVSIEATLPDPDKASIKSLEVRIDGFKLYTMSDSAGLWLPSKSIPLYAGPMQPGNHRLDVEARISMRESKPLPVNNPIYRFINKSFQWSIAEGVSNTRYRLTIQPPDKLDGAVDAQMQVLP